MKILHLSNYLPGLHDYWGGAESACINLIDLLLEAPPVLCAVGTTASQKAHQRTFPHFAIRTMDADLGSPYLARQRHFWLQRDPLAHRDVLAAIDQFQPQLVHFHNFSMLTFSALSAVKQRGLPAVASIYDYWLFCPTNMLLDLKSKICKQGHSSACLKRCLQAQIPTREEYLANLPVVFRPAYFKRQVARFDRVITLSENSRGLVRRYGVRPERIDVVPLPFAPLNGDSRSSTSEGDENEFFDQPTVLVTGWVQARKGQDVVVKAFAEVVKAIPEARLLIVGPLTEPPFERYLKTLASELGLANRVTLTGKLPQAEFERALAKAHVFVIAEQWENMSPVSLLEAMAQGKAMVCGEVGGIPEYVRDEQDGLLARYDDPRDYAKAIVRLIRDPELARRLGASARRRVAEKCDRGTIRARLMRSYEQVLH